MRNGKTKAIVKEFKDVKQSKGVLNLLLIVYIIASVTLFIYTGNVVRSMNQ